MAETLYKPLTWADLVADPTLQDLPYKIELSEDGKVMMSPAGKTHAKFQGLITGELSRRPGGQALTEIAVQCKGSARVIVADVAWVSDGRWATYADEGPLPTAPEICVEIQSPSNSNHEMARKVALYLEAGAEEVWIVTLDGSRRIHRPRPAAAG